MKSLRSWKSKTDDSALKDTKDRRQLKEIQNYGLDPFVIKNIIGTSETQMGSED